MVASLSLLSLALSALSLVNARAVPRHSKPDGYVEGYLEKYSTYRERYLALQCFKKHNTPFFDLCCHPMLATENLKDNRDSSCDPANAESSSSSSSEAAPTTTEVTQSTTSEVTQSTTSEVTQSTPTEPAQPPAQFNNGGNDDNDDDFEDCDDEGEYDDDEDLEDCEEEETGGQEQGQSQSAPTTQAPPPPPPTTTAEQVPTSTSTTEQATTSTTEQAPTSTTEQAPTSTADQAPTTTSTTEQAPTSTTEEQAPPTTAATTTTTSEQSQPTQDNGNGNQGGNQGGDLQLGGFATWYEQNGNAGSCGDYHGDGDLIAAIDHERYGDLGQKSGLCGQRVSITNNNSGKSVTVVIADVCPSCDNGNSIDLSKGAFQAIAELGEGHVPISWKFV